MSDYMPVNLERMPNTKLVHCSDGRFKHAFEARAEHHGVISPDRYTDGLVIPGPSYSIVDERTRPAILLWLTGLAKHRDWNVLSIYDHLHCGWMAENVGGYSRADRQEKIDMHVRYLPAALEIVKQALPNVPVEVHLLDVDKEIPIPSLSQRG